MTRPSFGWFALVLSLPLAAFPACRDTAKPALSPVAAAEPRAAFGAGQRLMTAGRFAEAVPWLRRATTGDGAARWGTHMALAYALRNEASLDSLHLGLRIPLTRSAIERVDLLREALEETQRAVRITSDPAQAAETARLQGMILSQWGFTLDALAIYRQADPLDTTGLCGRLAAGLAWQMDEARAR